MVKGVLHIRLKKYYRLLKIKIIGQNDYVFNKQFFKNVTLGHLTRLINNQPKGKKNTFLLRYMLLYFYFNQKGKRMREIIKDNFLVQRWEDFNEVLKELIQGLKNIIANYKIKVVPYISYGTGFYLNKILKRIINCFIRDINEILVWLSQCSKLGS